MPQFDDVVATQDWHPRDHKSFAVNNPGKQAGEVIELDGLPQVMWPAHCVQDTRGAELHAGLDRATDHRGVSQGHRSGDRQLQRLLRQRPPEGDRPRRLAARSAGSTRSYVLGLATDYCVKFTALDARELGLTVTLVEDGCRAVELAARRRRRGDRGDARGRRHVDERRLY